jgi:hypothetical protein
MPASLYSSVPLSLGAVIFAAQQMMLIERSGPIESLLCFDCPYWQRNGGISWSVLLAW